MPRKLITVPVTEPLSLLEAKAQCKIEPDFIEDDAFLTGLITDAREYVETITGRALITQVQEISIGNFPCGPLYLPLGSLQSIGTFAWTDSAASAHSWTFTTPNLLSGSTVMAHVENLVAPPERTLDAGMIVLAYGQSWPSETLKTGYPIRIRFTCGYGTAAQIPSELKRAMLLLISHWNENRDAVVLGNPFAVKSEPLQIAFDHLIANYRLYQ